MKQLPEFKNQIPSNATLECTACMKGKARAPDSPPQISRKFSLLERIASDICGPFRTSTPSGAKYFGTAIEMKSRYTIVETLKTKDQVRDFLERTIELLEAKTNQRLKELRTDWGGEYLETDFRNKLIKKGITYSEGVPGISTSNPVAERINRILQEQVKTYLESANLPLSLWGEALQFAVFCKNRMPHKTLQGKTPIEILLGADPINERARLRPFGQKVIYFDPFETNKLKPPGKEGRIVGFGSAFNSYRVYVGNGKIVVVKNPKSISEEQEKIWVEPTPLHSEIEPTKTEDNPQTVTESGSLRRSGRSTKGQSAERFDEIDWIADHECFSIHAEDTDNPTFDEAMNGSEKQQWKEACGKELKQLREFGVYEEVERTDTKVAGFRKLDVKWVLKKKRNENGDLIKYKARLTARGFAQIAGIDYHETEALTTRAPTHRLLLAMALAKPNWIIERWDVEGAYLNAPINERLAVIDDRVNPSKAWLLRKALYGSKQAAHNWEKMRNEILTEANLRILKKDAGVAVGKNCWISTHVDDMLVMGTKDAIKQVQEIVETHLDIDKLGRPTQWLGCELEWTDDRNIWITAERLIEKMCRLNLIPPHGKKTPIPPGWQRDRNSHGLDDVRAREYRSILGTAMYVATTVRPDLAYATSFLGQFMAAPTSKDAQLLIRTAQYMWNTKKWGITIKPEANHTLEMYTDAAYPGPLTDKKGQTGYVMRIGQTPVAWKSVKQRAVCLSTAESELMAASEGAKEALWGNQLLEEIGEKHAPIVLRIDSDAAEKMIKQRKETDRSRHIEIRDQWIRELVTEGKLHLQHVPGNSNLADMLTKPHSQAGLNELRKWADHSGPEQGGVSGMSGPSLTKDVSGKD